MRLRPDWRLRCLEADEIGRAGTTTVFNFGDDGSKLGDSASYGGNAAISGELYAHQVGRKQPNAWGLFDMHGNVFEWCRDWYSHGELPGGPTRR